MGFSGGGSNILKPHTHDGNISQDGGALDMNGVTQGSLTAGDLVYSDGSNLQRLGIGAANTSLQSNGSVPSWQSAGAAARTILDSQQLVNSTTDTITWTPASAIDDTTYQRLQLVIAGNGLGNNISACYFRLNSGLTNTSYNQNGIEVFGGAASYVNKNPQSAGADWIRIVDDTGAQSFLTIVDIETPTATDKSYTTINYCHVNEDRWVNGSGYVTDLGTGISRIQVEYQKPANAADLNWCVYGIAY